MWVLEYLWKHQRMLASALAEDYKAQLMMLRPTIWIMVPNMVYLHSNSYHFLQYFSKVFQGDTIGLDPNTFIPILFNAKLQDLYLIPISTSYKPG